MSTQARNPYMPARLTRGIMLARDEGVAAPEDVESGAAEMGSFDIMQPLQQVYRATVTLAGLLNALLERVVSDTSLLAAELVVDSAGIHMRTAPDRRGGSARAVTTTVPIAACGRSLGVLHVSHPRSIDVETASPLFRALAGTIAGLVQRENVRRYARHHLGADLGFVGCSSALRHLEDRITRLAPLALPVLITGEFGCEQRTVAIAVHVAGRPAGRFVEVWCGDATAPAAFEATLARALAEAEDGTLFLGNVDEMNPACQRRLAACLETFDPLRTGILDSGRRRHHQRPVRIVASASRDLCGLADRGALSRTLWSALDFLRVDVPPLRMRRDDIPHLVHHVTATLGHDALGAFTPDAMERLVAYPWPGNLSELARVTARLLAAHDGSVIDVSALNNWADELAAAAADPTGQRDADAAPEADLDEALSDSAHQTPTMDLSVFASRLLDEGLGPEGSRHPGLERALAFLRSHFNEEVSLDKLAKESCVSPSYLCALFKRAFNVGFKRVQSVLRVEKAKRLLVDAPYQRITEVALEVGFGDFSHFVKTFKRLTHMSPREYRRRHAATGLVAVVRRDVQ